MRIVFLFSVCFAMLFPGQAHALCVGTVLSGVPATATFSSGAGGYHVYDSAEYMQTLSFQVDSMAGIGGCRFYAVLSAGSSGSSSARTMLLGADSLNYNVYTSASKDNILGSVGSYNAADVLSGSFPFILNLLQSSTYTLHWTIPPGQVVRSNASYFNDTTLTLSLYAEFLIGIYTLADSKTITFRTQVESDVDLSLVDTGGAINLGDTMQTLNFGNLSSGQVMAYDTMIRSNTGYSLTMQSQNAQILLHQNAPAVNASIPYSLTVNGGAVNLSGGGSVLALSGTGVTPVSGLRLPTQFTIGAMTGAESTGIYQDVISLTLSAN